MKASVVLFFALLQASISSAEKNVRPLKVYGCGKVPFLTHLTIVDTVTPTRLAASLIGILSDSSVDLVFRYALAYLRSFITACLVNKLVRKAAALTSI